MKALSIKKINIKESFGSKSSKMGGYSLAITAVVLAIVIAFNVLVGVLPNNLTHYDISSTKLYSLTSNSKVVLSALDKDVDIYWITQAGEEDEVVEKLLGKYEASSSHINVIKKNPDVYPTFAKQYTSSTVNNNDLVIMCGDVYRYISYADIYEYDTTYYYYTGTYDVYFDGEGAITSAINYVSSDDLPLMYVLTGHGEQDFGENMTAALSKANIETEEFSLLTIDEIPEDADCVMIYAPTSDISEYEKDMLKDYLDDGGKLLVVSGIENDTDLSTLNSLLSEYGVDVVDGIVVEGDRSAYAAGMPYVLVPTIESSEITDPLVEEGSYVIVPIASGLEENGNAPYGVTIEELLTTSSDSFSKVDGYAITTYEEEENDIHGPFALAVAITDSTAAEDSKLVWIGSSYLIDDSYDSYASGANSDLVLNSISWLDGEENQISIRSKSMNNEYLSISDSQASFLKTIMLAFVPCVFLLMGIVELISRRKA